jgi:hypothetical protein
MVDAEVYQMVVWEWRVDEDVYRLIDVTHTSKDLP